MVEVLTTRAVLAAMSLALSSGAVYAIPCTDMSGLPPLKSMSLGKNADPGRVVEALLYDAEMIYAEGAHIVARQPKTDTEADALPRMENLHVGGESFHVKECNFQNVFNPMLDGADRKYSESIAWTLTRIGQFDNFVFNAVTETYVCSNTSAKFDLRISRQILDYAWMEFKRRTSERDWDPNFNGPETHESCTND